MAGDFFDFLENLARTLRASTEPFGGIQIILGGDMAQLPPVDLVSGGYCFQSTAWQLGKFSDRVGLLTKVHRLNSDDAFVRILSEIRNGRCPQWCSDILQQHSVDKKPLPEGTICPALFCKNADVDKINEEKLRSLPGESQRYPSEYGFIDLKENAEVLLTEHVGDLPPGSKGYVASLGVQSVRVKFASCEEDVWLRRGFMPLRLAWALTVHRAQGMSLDCAQIRIDNAFESGHAYVALSRLRSLQGLYLVGSVSQDCVRVASSVLQFLAQLRETQACASTPETNDAREPDSHSTTLDLLRKQLAEVSARAVELKANKNASAKDMRRLQVERDGLRRDVKTFRNESMCDKVSEYEIKYQECNRAYERQVAIWQQVKEDLQSQTQESNLLAYQIVVLEKSLKRTKKKKRETDTKDVELDIGDIVRAAWGELKLVGLSRNLKDLLNAIAIHLGTAVDNLRPYKETIVGCVRDFAKMCFDETQPAETVETQPTVEAQPGLVCNISDLAVESVVPQLENTMAPVDEQIDERPQENMGMEREGAMGNEKIEVPVGSAGTEALSNSHGELPEQNGSTQRQLAERKSKSSSSSSSSSSRDSSSSSSSDSSNHDEQERPPKKQRVSRPTTIDVVANVVAAAASAAASAASAAEVAARIAGTLPRNDAREKAVATHRRAVLGTLMKDRPGGALASEVFASIPDTERTHFPTLSVLMTTLKSHKGFRVHPPVRSRGGHSGVPRRILTVSEDAVPRRRIGTKTAVPDSNRGAPV